jgi:hypothetical protein
MSTPNSPIVTSKDPTVEESPSELKLVPPQITPNPSNKQKVYLRNDTGNADRLRDAQGQNLIYCPEHGVMVWTGRHWKLDTFIFIERLAEQVVRKIFSEAVLWAMKRSDPQSASLRTRHFHAKELQTCAIRSNANFECDAYLILIAARTFSM